MVNKYCLADSIKPEMIIDNTRMSDSFRDYLRPLVQGEVKLIYKDGIAPVTNLKRIKVK